MKSIRRTTITTFACAALLLPIASSAQLPFRVTGQFGVGVMEETRKCMQGSNAMPGLELMSRGSKPMSSAISPARFEFFATARAEIFGGIGAYDLCQVLPSVDTLADGRILAAGHDELEIKGGGTQFSVGAGVGRTVMDGIAGELRINAGVARGQRDFESTWMRVAGASAGIVLLDHLVIAFEQRWYRVPRWERQYAAQEAPENWQSARPAGSTTHHTWQRFRGWAIGYRF